MPCTNNTPSLAASFPRSVGSWLLTLVALHNLQRITGTINGCLSDSEATARTAQVPLEILRLCCSNSTGNTPREGQVVHFSLSWWRQRKMQELIYIYIGFSQHGPGQVPWNNCASQWSVMPHWSISQSLQVPCRIAKETWKHILICS